MARDIGRNPPIGTAYTEGTPWVHGSSTGHARPVQRAADIVHRAAQDVHRTSTGAVTIVRASEQGGAASRWMDRNREMESDMIGRLIRRVLGGLGGRRRPTRTTRRGSAESQLAKGAIRTAKKKL